MLDELKHELEKLTATGRWREFCARQGRVGGRIQIRGSSVVDFTNWDFFDLNSDSRVKRALQVEVEQNGISAGSARLSSGTLPAHLTCEARLAKFLGTESAVLFSSRNQAVLSLIAGLVREGDCVLVDEALQSPVLDASYLVNADVLHFKSHDPDSLERVLENTKHYKKKFLVLESLSPLTGDVTSLTRFSDLAVKWQLNMLVDESYALGILGARGAGGVEAANLLALTMCQYGSMSLALGGYGAFVAGPRILIDFLINRSRTFRGEVVLPACLAAAAETAINVVELETGKRERLKLLALKLRHGLKSMGVPVPALSDVPVVGVYFAKLRIAEELSRTLFQKGFLCDVVASGVPLDEGAYVRFLLNSHHTEKTVDELLQAVTEIWGRMDAV